MPRFPRLTDADRADLAARHKVVSARIIASEDIARKVIREPAHDATRHLIARVAGGAADAASVKRSLFAGVRQLSSALSTVASGAVEKARDHARALASGQVGSDLETFVARARALALPARAPHQPITKAVATIEQDAAIAHQAGLNLAHKWSSQMLGNYSKWYRGSGGTDALIRSLEAAGAGERGPLADLIETHAITQSVDAYADQHALVWNGLAQSAAAIEEARGGEPDPELTWMAGMFDVWSAILDRNTCSVCGALDGQMVRMGDDFPGGRPPNHVRCRCCGMAMWVPEAAMKALPGVQLDYELLKEDVRQYARGASLDIGEGRRHARQFYEQALASDGRTALADALSGRRSYFSAASQPRAPRLLF